MLVVVTIVEKMSVKDRPKGFPARVCPMASQVKDSTFWITVFAALYLALLPMSGTIALRNVTLVLLCGFLIWCKLRNQFAFQWPIPVLLWVSYLLLFPFISEDPSIAVHSLVSQWGRGLVAMMAGTGVASVLFNKNRSSAFNVGLISALPILLHLFLFAWKAWETSSIPWGYWGRESHHADLGYAAGQSVVLFAAAIAAGKNKNRRWAFALILACLLSTALASSRAGLAFALVGGVLVFSIVCITRAKQQYAQFFLAILGLLFAGLAFLSIAVKEDSRWPTMSADLLVGFLGNPIQIECEGTSSIKSQIIAQFGAGEKAERVISSVNNGDAARVVVLRAGITLATKHPWGSDGSRLAYQNLLKKQCADPAILMAHTHNGWLDTVLTLGWVGGALYFTVLLYFLIIGYRFLKTSTNANEWAIVLAALASFWILRGAIDSVFKDHMLEMQGFLLAYAATSMRFYRIE